MNHSDPYDLLRRARAIIERNKYGGANAQWLKDFKKLPGAKLTQRAVRVLRNPHRRHTDNGDVIAALLKAGYLQEVRCIGGPESRWTQVRVSPLGREALRLREDVK